MSKNIWLWRWELTVKNLLYWWSSSREKVFFKLKKRKDVVSLFTFDLYRLTLDKMREWLRILTLTFISLILGKNVLLPTENCLFNLNFVKFPTMTHTGKKVTSGVSYQRCDNVEKKMLFLFNNKSNSLRHFRE